MMVRGLDLAIAEAGAGATRRILLLHGFAGAKEDFSDWLDVLAAAGWHGVTYDQRGHGGSAHPEAEVPFSLQIFTDDVRALVDELGWDRFVLLGHSMGGMIAQLFALQAPDRLDGLVLMGTSHGPPDGIHAELVELGQEVVREGGTAALIAAQKDFGPGPLDTAAHRRLVVRRPDYEQYCEGKTLAASDQMWVAMAGEMLTQPDRLGAVEGLKMPVLVIVGSYDETFLQQCGNLAGAIPTADLVVIGGAGHSPQFEAPDEWWSALSRFLVDCG